MVITGVQDTKYCCILSHYLFCNRSCQHTTPKLSQDYFLDLAAHELQSNEFLISPPLLTIISSLRSLFLRRHNLQICDMHFPIELAMSLVTSWNRAMMASVADRIAAAIRLSTWEAPRQIAQSIQLLAIQVRIMARGAASVRTFPTEVMVVTELHVSKP